MPGAGVGPGEQVDEEGTHVVAHEDFADERPIIKLSQLSTEADIKEGISNFLLSLPLQNTDRDATIELAVEEILLQVMHSNARLQSTLTDW